MSLMPPLLESTAGLTRSWKRGTFPVIGLVGGIGSGKSTVAREFERQGAWVFDADQAGHVALADPKVRDLLRSRFGCEVFGPGGVPDRKRLAAMVFTDPAARADLETIVHPKIRSAFEALLARAKVEPPVAVVLDAAILLESGWDEDCDLIVFVDAPAAERALRVLEQRHWPEEELARRESVQWPLERKRSRADVLIANDRSSDLADQVDRFLSAHIAFPPPVPHNEPIRSQHAGDGPVL